MIIITTTTCVSTSKSFSLFILISTSKVCHHRLPSRLFSKHDISLQIRIHSKHSNMCELENQNTCREYLFGWMFSFHCYRSSQKDLGFPQDDTMFGIQTKLPFSNYLSITHNNNQALIFLINVNILYIYIKRPFRSSLSSSSKVNHIVPTFHRL